jgi:Family of unknown function (DUF5996)
MTLPGLHLDDWRATKDTLHLYSQILGKIRLATTTPRNHWWNAALYVDVRGLTTRRLHHRDTTFEITIDFIDDTLIVRTGDGRIKSFGIGSGMPVADFDARIHATLSELGVDVNIKEEPFGVPTTTPSRTTSNTRLGTARPSPASPASSERSSSVSVKANTSGGHSSR